MLKFLYDGNSRTRSSREEQYASGKTKIPHETEIDLRSSVAVVFFATAPP
jgi:hypothetical protein